MDWGRTQSIIPASTQLSVKSGVNIMSQRVTLFLRG
jgi:hypothetical protein